MRKFYSALFYVGLPIAIQHLVISSGTLMDNFMVTGLGKESIAAVGAIDKFVRIFWFIIFGVSSAGSTFIGQAKGRGDRRVLGNTVGIILTINVAFALLFTSLSLFFPNQIASFAAPSDGVVRKLAANYLFFLSLSYIPSVLSTTISYTLRGVGNTKPIVYSSLIFVSSNVLLNYLFIFGSCGFPALGVNGAAMATAISKIIETLFVLIYLYFMGIKVLDNFIDLFNFNKKLMLNIVGVSVPYGLSGGLLSTGFFMYQAFFGQFGANAMAAYAIVTMMEAFVMNLFHGISGGVLILLSQDIGHREYSEAYEDAKRSIRVALISSSLIGLSLYMVSNSLVRKYALLAASIKGEELSEGSVLLAIYMIQILSLLLPLKVFNLVSLHGIIKSGGDAFALLLIENGSLWLFGIPLLYIISISPINSALAIYIALYFEEAIKAIWSWKRVKSREWDRSLID